MLVIPSCVTLLLCCCWCCCSANSQGAYYSDYYWPLHPEATADAVLVALAAYHRAAAIPVRTYQLDPFWYPRDSAGAMTDWAPVPSLFPRGLGPLAAPPYNLSFLLYSAYFSLNASAQRLSNYSWVASEVGRVHVGEEECKCRRVPARCPSCCARFQAMPDSPTFIGRVAVTEAAALYAELIARGADWGVVGLEVDWFMKQTVPFADEQVRIEIAGRPLHEANPFPLLIVDYIGSS